MSASIAASGGDRLRDSHRLQPSGTEPASAGRLDLSVDIAVVLIAMYALGLLFEHRTHRELFSHHEPGDEDASVPGQAVWTVGKALGVLAGATLLVAWMGELLVGRWSTRQRPCT